MTQTNLIQNLEQLTGTKAELIDLNSELIKKKGVYKLDDNAYFMLYPEYLKDSDKTEIMDTTNKFDYSQLSKNSRETYFIGPTYSYGNVTHPTNENWDQILLKHKATLELKVLSPFNSVLVNRYSKDQDIPFHKDNEDCLGHHPTIASLSVGDSGRMIVKNNKDEYIEILLSPGTLLIMGGTFNKDYFHSVARSSNSKKKYRINLTYRFISQLLNVNTGKKSQEESPLAKEIKEMKSQLSSLRKHLEKDNRKEEENRNKVVILKCPHKEAISKESITKVLNEHLDSLNQISTAKIQQVNDYRDKNGPITIQFNNTKDKVNLLTHFKNFKDIIIRDCLSSKNAKLRKQAILLHKKNIIQKVWTYRGDVYFSLPGSSDRILACWDNLNCLAGGNSITAEWK